MALIPQLKICAKNNCTQLSITDTTGAYDASTNTGGYGAPNIDPGDAGFSATISVNGGDPIDVTSQVPSTVTGDFTYDLIDAELTDGWQTIVYTVTTDATSDHVNTVKIFTYCTIRCCVFSKMVEAKELDPCKDLESLLVYFQMWNLYKAMLYEANGCNATEASKTLARLQALCDTDDDDCGCS